MSGTTESLHGWCSLGKVKVTRKKMMMDGKVIRQSFLVPMKHYDMQVYVVVQTQIHFLDLSTRWR
jgi:hypothetical protein